MSTKTLRKRVALIAVSAMGFGLISGVTPANATGVISLDSASSVGLLSPTGNIGDNLTSTATLLSTGKLNLDIADTDNVREKVVVSAGGYIESVVAMTVALDQQSATQSVADSTTSITDLVIRPNGAAGSTFTITTYANETTSTAKNRITVTIAAASVAGTADAAKSSVVWSNYNESLDLSSSVVDSGTASETTTGLPLYAHIKLRDSYGNAITSTSGALVVTASTGAKVGLAGAGAAAAGNYVTAVSNASPADISVYVSEATSGAGWSGTLSVTYNGIQIATKTGKITGQASKLEVEVVKVGRNNGAASTNALRFKATDPAGNTIPLGTSDVTFDEATPNGIVSTAAATTASTTDTRGYGSFTCASTATGKASIVLKHTTSAGVTIKSAPVDAYCGGAAATYSAALDKAKYAQGDVAKLTVTFKDAKGALANSYDSITVESATNASISFPMTKQIGAIAYSDLPNSKGQVEYKFNVGDVSSFSAGKYNAVVTFGTPADGSAQTVAYEVTGAGGVSNSDILASIVKLITAINKQIAALQKLLLRR